MRKYLYGLYVFIVLWVMIMTGVCVSTWDATYTKAYQEGTFLSNPLFINEYLVGHYAGRAAWLSIFVPLVIEVLVLGIALVIATTLILDENKSNDTSEEAVELDDFECSDPSCRCAYHRAEQFNAKKGVWRVTCRNPSCRCVDHNDEYFNTKKGKWKEAEKY